jgi:hypothetical protein
MPISPRHHFPFLQLSLQALRRPLTSSTLSMPVIWILDDLHVDTSSPLSEVLLRHGAPAYNNLVYTPPLSLSTERTSSTWSDHGGVVRHRVPLSSARCKFAVTTSQLAVLSGSSQWQFHVIHVAVPSRQFPRDSSQWQVPAAVSNDSFQVLSFKTQVPLGKSRRRQVPYHFLQSSIINQIYHFSPANFILFLVPSLLFIADAPFLSPSWQFRWLSIVVHPNSFDLIIITPIISDRHITMSSPSLTISTSILVRCQFSLSTVGSRPLFVVGPNLY